MEHFPHHLRGKYFALYTDHKPLVNLGGVHTKALSQIQEARIKYDFEIIYQQRKWNACRFFQPKCQQPYLSNIVSLTWTRSRILDRGDKKLYANRISMQDHYRHQLHEKLLEQHIFIKDAPLWVWIKLRGEPARVCLLLPAHKISEVLKNIIYWSWRSGQNKIQTTAKLFVTEYGINHFGLYQELWKVPEKH